MVMQVQRESSQEEKVQELQSQLDELTTANLLLQDQLARKEQFTAMIAHELRGPLTPIINYAQMLNRSIHSFQNGDANQQVRSGEAMQRHNKIIISQARRMSRLVNDLLDASHLSSGQFTLLREPCDIVVLVHEVVEQLRPVAPYHTLVVETPDRAISGNWDSGRLQQALGNLLDNAIKYSDEGSTITVRLWTTPDFVHVSVHNQGAGIPSDDTELLFRPYMRLASASSRQGSGLGLYITKSIIDTHGGELHLEPYVEDGTGPKGATFCFDLPLS